MQSKIEQNVMGSVAAIYAARKLASPTALKLYALVLAFLGSAMFVSLPHVLQNLTQVGIQGLPTFLWVAVMKTQTIVQAALVVGLLAAFSLFADILRAPFRSGVFAH